MTCVTTTFFFAGLALDFNFFDYWCSALEEEYIDLTGTGVFRFWRVEMELDPLKKCINSSLPRLIFHCR